MMVDDEPIMMDIVQAFLEDEGYHQFVTVDQSPEAIDTLNNNQPDILLLDLDMPEVNGFDILKELRSSPKHMYLPVIILTASSESDSKLKALEYGATDFLSKPIDPSELALRLRNTLAAKAYQDQLAYYDALTGLPNRALFIDRLNWAIAQAGRERKPLALLDIGLDRFRQINETLGPQVGDKILKIIADRLLEVVRGSDVISRSLEQDASRSLARLGGDEFSIIICGVENVRAAEIVIKRVLSAIKEPIEIDGNEIFLSAGIGVSVYPNDGADADAVIKNAGSAKEFAKQDGADNFKFYSKKMNASSRERLNMEFKLRHALEKNELVLFYQPKVDANSGKVLGMESLIRWIDPEKGMISPVLFIPVAEATGLIVPIGEWVIEEACRQTQEWIKAGYDLKVSVNVSGRQFSDNGLQRCIKKSLLKSGLHPKHLVIEITESMMMGNAEENIIMLKELKELGISISIDDFGTGYSSLSYLKKFPIDELKIDRSFILDVPTNQDDSSIVKAIIAMAHALDLSVVTEGVEEESQLNFLRECNCDIIQGFYFSKPLDSENFTKYLLNDKKV